MCVPGGKSSHCQFTRLSIGTKSYRPRKIGIFPVLSFRRPHLINLRLWIEKEGAEGRRLLFKAIKAEYPKFTQVG
jgi:hypothetical protein